MSNVEISKKPPVPFSKIKGDDYDDGQVIMTIAGTITSLYDPKKGDTYEYQNGKMKDSEGTEIDICFSKNSQPLTAKGKKLTIRSVKTEKHGWNGVKVEDQRFTPQGADEEVTKRVLKITATAEIVYEGGSDKASSGDKPSAGGGSRSSGHASAPPDTHPETFLTDAVHFHLRCHTYASQAYPDVLENKEMNREALDNSAIRQACTASLYIEGCRNGMHVNYVERAAKPVPPKIVPPPKDPALWATCMIPKGTMAGQTLSVLTDEQLTTMYDAVKDSKTDFANCVKFGFEERGLLKKRQEEDGDLDPEEADDIPF